MANEKREKKSKKKAKKRVERKFLPESSQNRGLVAGLGGVGSAVLGAGMYGQLYASNLAKKAAAAFEAAKDAAVARGTTIEPPMVTPMMIMTIAGAALVMGAVWLGTSAEAAVRVGAPGVGLDKNGNIKRIPWHALTSLEWDESEKTIVLAGKEEGGESLTIRVSAKTQPTACAWIVKEASFRAAALAKNLPENLAERLPEATDGGEGGEKIELEPLHVVGRRCAVTNEIIAYEPDALICSRCERVYTKEHAPAECACGETLLGEKSEKAAPSGETERVAS